ncbi:MAG: 2-dehydropantoate 2-reductase [Chloroflexota bacterium]|nr:2-dehydropantoate 2-reductase [Chloroflexota bacterium]
MKIGVMAAGGLGGYYGALLARDGHDVTYIARGAHLKAIRSGGLVIRSIHGDVVHKPAKATDNPAEVGPVDWILFGVKTYDTIAAAQAMRPMVGANTAVITFQNGVESADQIGANVGMEHVLVAPTQIVSNITAPGLIEQKSPFRSTTVGEVSGQGLTPRVEKIVAELKRTGVDASAAADGRKPLWHKFVFIASTSGLASLARTAPYDLFQLPEARATLHAAMAEVYAVGKALGAPMDDDIVERQYQFTLKFGPGQKPSMQLDVEQGKRLEIDALSGAVVRLGAAKGIATPVHQTIYVGLKMEDTRRTAPSKS